MSSVPCIKTKRQNISVLATLVWHPGRGFVNFSHLRIPMSRSVLLLLHLPVCSGKVTMKLMPPSWSIWRHRPRRNPCAIGSMGTCSMTITYHIMPKRSRLRRMVMNYWWCNHVLYLCSERQYMTIALSHCFDGSHVHNSSKISVWPHLFSYLTLPSFARCKPSAVAMTSCSYYSSQAYFQLVAHEMNLINKEGLWIFDASRNQLTNVC